LPTQNADLRWYLSADEDELFAKLGSHLLGDGLGVGPGDEEEAQRFGKAWFDARLEDLRSLVCEQAVVKQLSGDLSGDLVDVAALVLPLVGNQQLLALTLAGIIVRRGIASFCKVG